TFQRVVVPEDAGRVQIGGLPAGRYALKVNFKPCLMQVGIDPDGEPVTMIPADSQLFYQEFTLEPGETYRFTCPDDSAHLNAEQWLSAGVSPDDLAVRSAIVGTWVSLIRAPNGSPIYGIEHYASDG